MKDLFAAVRVEKEIDLSNLESSNITKPYSVQVDFSARSHRAGLNSNNSILLLAISGHVAFLRDFVDLVAVPDRPNPAYDKRGSHSLA